MARGSFYRLFKGGNSLLLVEAITKAIEHSYSICTMNHRTAAEDKRRFELCAELYDMLESRPFLWATTRIIEHLPRFLVEKLENRSWQPRFREMWSPEAQLKAPE